MPGVRYNIRNIVGSHMVMNLQDAWKFAVKAEQLLSERCKEYRRIGVDGDSYGYLESPNPVDKSKL